MSEIQIRLAKTWDECVQCEELQKRVWDMPDYRDVVPANLLITAIKNGGLLVGAFDGDKMVGFAFGFLGSEGETRRLKHTSHMLAVLPDARAKGLGAEMKWFQRAESIKQGLDLMTWTYDPLQATNAYLNIARLGAIARRYFRNAYGDMTDALNVGVASDRFEVEWYLDSQRVLARQTASPKPTEPLQSLYQVEWGRDGLPLIGGENDLEDETILVEIPADYNAMKATHHELAIEWRERTRSTLERAFGQGYVVTDFVRKTDDQNRARVGYVLVKNFEME